MIIVIVRSGQMCNQLMTLGCAYAIGLEYSVKVLCPIIDEKLKEYFVFKRPDVLDDNVRMYHSFGWETVSVIARIAEKIFHLDYRRRIDVAAFRSKRQYYFRWDGIKDEAAFIKHQADIRSFFRFRPEIEQKCNEMIRSICSDQKTCVGVHIRRRDYRQHNGGKWCFSDEDYCRWMRHLNMGDQARFVLFSDEEIDLEFFTREGLDAVSIHGSAIEDLCSLSMCDYIMGPPSTYSMWASMYGNKRKLVLEDKNAVYCWDDFLYLSERKKLV